MGQVPGSRRGWFTTTLRWLWGADDDVGLRRLFSSTPAAWILLGLFCAVSIADYVLAGSVTTPGPLTERLGTTPAGIASGQWWRLVTTTLINAPERNLTGPGHLWANVFPFVLVAPRVERALGSTRLVGLFVLTSISGAVPIYVATRFYWQASGGTSNAVYGLIGAVLVIAFFRRRRSTPDTLYFGAALLAVVTLGVDALGASAGTNVAHLGGFIAGSLMAAAWCVRPKARVGLATAVALVVVALGLTAMRTADVRESDIEPRTVTPVGFQLEGLATGFGSLWVAGEEQGQIVRVDERIGRVVARIRLEHAGGIPVAAHDRLWVPRGEVIAAIDPATNRVASSIRMPKGLRPWSLAATKGALWAAVPDEGLVVRVDLRSGEQRRVATGAGTYIVATHGRNLYATSYDGHAVSRLDPSTGRVLVERLLADRVYLTAFLDGSLWVGAQPYIYRLEPETLRVLAKIDIGHDTWTLTPHKGKLIVAGRWARSLVRVDPATNEVDRRFEVGLRQPIAVAITSSMWIADAYRNALISASPPD